MIMIFVECKVVVHWLFQGTNLLLGVTLFPQNQSRWSFRRIKFPHRVTLELVTSVLSFDYYALL